MSEQSGAQLVTPDDLPPNARACFLASRQHDREHQSACPDCLEVEAETPRLDAASRRADGNESTARELEAEAAEMNTAA